MAAMKENIDPRMHSAEHILNQTMIRMFNCGRCFSAHIEKKKSKCDYHFDRTLTEDEIKMIENKINEIINSNLELNDEFITLEEAQTKFDLKRVPEGQGKIRIVRIGDYDATTCIGQHVKNTSEIGKFKIISSNYDQGVLRIRYKLQ
jgi:Ser-tRNA(Ala) deacylase AlaX